MDQELIAFLETRFLEVSQQIASLRGEFEGFREETGRNFARVDENLARVDENFARVDENFARVDENFARVDENFARVDENFARVDENFARVDGEIRKVGGLGLMIEDLRHQVQIVAEGVTGANERLDAFRAEVAQEFKDVRSLIHLSYKDLDRRIRRSDDDAEGLSIGTPG